MGLDVLSLMGDKESFIWPVSFCRLDCIWGPVLDNKVSQGLFYQ